jgi:hypothetical protein
MCGDLLVRSTGKSRFLVAPLLGMTNLGFFRNDEPWAYSYVE